MPQLERFPKPESKQEQEFFIEKELNLKNQYEAYLKSLNESAVLQLLLKKEALGVIGLDGKEYPIPEYEKIAEVMEANREILKLKIEQGFTKLQLTPLAAPIEILKDRFAKLLIKHHKEGRLFQTRKDPKDIGVPLELNLQEPVYIYEGFTQGEISGHLLYYPQKFDDKKPGGHTKAELIELLKNSPFPGWEVLLIEPNPFLPKVGEGRVLGGRHQLENNQTPKEYLAKLNGDSCNHESGLTIEDFLTYAIERLHAENEVSHDWNDHNVTFLIGNYLKTGPLPFGCWNRGVRGADVGVDYSDDRGAFWGVRPAVRVSKF